MYKTEVSTIINTSDTENIKGKNKRKKKFLVKIKKRA